MSQIRQAVMQTQMTLFCLTARALLYKGGPGLGILDGCIVAEELSWGCTGISTASTASGLAVCCTHQLQNSLCE